jgi:DNA (cytosine-5)-methyltransferase 1
MTHGSLFSGIGGFDLAAEWMGWENKFHCEWNEFGQKVLKYYWPNAISYGDITKTDFSIWNGRIDIVTGGFPCQPFSTAGKRKGKEDNRYLWPEMLRAVKEIQPGWIVAENVYGIINQGRGMVFEQVQVDMENEGYQVQSYVLPACAVNAPHKRERFWFLAYSDKNRKVVQGGNGSCNNEKWNSKTEIQERENEQFGIKQSSAKTIADPQRIGQQRSRRPKRQFSTEAFGNREASWTYPNDRWPTQSPIRGRNDGLSGKLAKQCLEAYGNAIVPQVALEIFKTIEQYELESSLNFKVK